MPPFSKRVRHDAIVIESSIAPHYISELWETVTAFFEQFPWQLLEPRQIAELLEKLLFSGCSVKITHLN